MFSNEIFYGMERVIKILILQFEMGIKMRRRNLVVESANMKFGKNDFVGKKYIYIFFEDSSLHPCNT